MPNAQSKLTPEPVAQDSSPAVSPVFKSAERATSCGSAALESRDTAEPEACATAATHYASVCRFLSELLLYPEERDARKLTASADEAAQAAPELRETITALLASPEREDCDTYLEMFEISPKCPLHLGHYLFEEPKRCSGAGVSGRNEYMIQLKNLYRHFSFDLQTRELPDFLPLMLDFLALTATHSSRKHRRLLVKQFMLPALPALAKALRSANNVYSPVADILEQLLHGELGEEPTPPPPGRPAGHPDLRPLGSGP
jgi:nitrate reductase delta subunit